MRRAPMAVYVGRGVARDLSFDGGISTPPTDVTYAESYGRIG